MSNQMTKALLKNDLFWSEPAAILPTTADGLAAHSPCTDDGAVLVDPFQELLVLMRKLGLQLLSWKPGNVQLRDIWAQRAHKLWHALKLSKKRFSVAVNY